MMKTLVSRLLGASLMVLAGTAAAQNITRLVVAFPPGGPQDFVARVMAQKLGDVLHQQVLVDNLPGANGAIAAIYVARAEPDGRTLWLTSVGPAVINKFLYQKLAYDMERDFTPVSLLTNNSSLLVVQPGNPANNAAEFVAQSKLAKVPFAMASTGIGSVPHLALEQLRRNAGANVLHVPYKGAAPAITDLLGGQVRAMFGDEAGLISYVKGGSLKALGLAAPQRSAALPDVPTLIEQGLPAIDSDNWFALYVSSKTPMATVKAINAAVRTTLQDPSVHNKLVASGSDPAPSSVEGLAALMKVDSAKWGKLVREANIKLED
jgi:tripartite-type tricarboxylate transporter receptor subunit TctC